MRWTIALCPACASCSHAAQRFIHTHVLWFMGFRMHYWSCDPIMIHTTPSMRKLVMVLLPRILFSNPIHNQSGETKCETNCTVVLHMPWKPLVRIPTPITHRENRDAKKTGFRALLRTRRNESWFGMKELFLRPTNARFELLMVENPYTLFGPSLLLEWNGILY